MAEFDGKEYTVKKIAGGSFDQREGVEYYANWSNNIHMGVWDPMQGLSNETWSSG